MKNNIKLFLVGFVLLSACGNESTLEEMKTQKQEVEQNIKTLKVQLADLEAGIRGNKPS